MGVATELVNRIVLITLMRDVHRLTFMVLSSTYFVSTASNTRLFADVAALLGVFHYRTTEARTRVVKAAVIAIPVFTLVAYHIIKAPVTLVLIGGTAQALMLPFLGFAAVWCRRRIAPSLRAGPGWTSAVWSSRPSPWPP